MEEMSGHWLASGRELTMKEYNTHLRRSRVARSNSRFESCWKSFLWLQARLGLTTDFGLAEMLSAIDIDGSADFYYPPRVIPKSEGGSRIIITPKPKLMLVQKKLHKLLLKTFLKPFYSFGHRGGSCIELVKRHRYLKSTLKLDIKDAFFKVGYARLRGVLRGYRLCEFERGEWKWTSKFSTGFSASVAHWIAKLCTYSPVPNIATKVVPFRAQSFLPQGAPTSPICFDLACGPLDRKLQKIATRVGGVMSRYADNYYFSMPTPTISPKLEAMIVCTTQKRYGFPIHKLRNVSQGELCKILGYNIINGNIRNTRGFLRKLRGALYVLQTKIDRGLDYQDAHLRVEGLMQWAINLPDNLQQVYANCIDKISQT